MQQLGLSPEDAWRSRIPKRHPRLAGRRPQDRGDGQRTTPATRLQRALAVLTTGRPAAAPTPPRCRRPGRTGLCRRGAPARLARALRLPLSPPAAASTPRCSHRPPAFPCSTGSGRAGRRRRRRGRQSSRAGCCRNSRARRSGTQEVPDVERLEQVGAAPGQGSARRR